MHLIRVVGQLQFTVEGWAVPQWISPVEIVVATFMSYQGFRLAWRQKKPAQRE